MLQSHDVFKRCLQYFFIQHLNPRQLVQNNPLKTNQLGNVMFKKIMHIAVLNIDINNNDIKSVFYIIALIFINAYLMMYVKRILNKLTFFAGFF